MYWETRFVPSTFSVSVAGLMPLRNPVSESCTMMDGAGGVLSPARGEFEITIGDRRSTNEDSGADTAPVFPAASRARDKNTFHPSITAIPLKLKRPESSANTVAVTVPLTSSSVEALGSEYPEIVSDGELVSRGVAARTGAEGAVVST